MVAGPGRSASAIESASSFDVSLSGRSVILSITRFVPLPFNFVPRTRVYNRHLAGLGLGRTWAPSAMVAGPGRSASAIETCPYTLAILSVELKRRCGIRDPSGSRTCIIHFSFFIIHYSLFEIHYSSFVIRDSQFVFNHSLSIVHHSLFTIDIHYSGFIIHYSLFIIHNSPFGMRDPRHVRQPLLLFRINCFTRRSIHNNHYSLNARLDRKNYIGQARS